MSESVAVTVPRSTDQPLELIETQQVALTSARRGQIWLAEFIGTFSLVLIGVGAITVGLSGLGVAVAFGSIVAVMIAAVGPISAAHFNPAVTVGCIVLRRMGVKMAALYWSAQFLGAALAVLLLQCILGRSALSAVSFGATRLQPEFGLLPGLATEIILTFFLMFVIASIVIRTHALDGIYIGMTVGLCALVGGPLTGASMNPARSFGPALFGGIWSDHWIYWLGPLVGAAIGAATARYLWKDVHP